MAFLPLVFKDSPASTGEIVFGEGSSSTAIVRISGTLPGPVVDVLAEQVTPSVQTEIVGDLPGIDGTSYLQGINLGILVPVRFGVPWQGGTAASEIAPVAWASSAGIEVATAEPWRDGVAALNRAAAAWAPMDSLAEYADEPWRDGTELRFETSESWQAAVPVWFVREASWRDGLQAPASWVMPWQAGVALETSVSAAYGPGTRLVDTVTAPWGWADLVPRAVREPWQTGDPIESHGGGPLPVPPLPGDPCYTPDGSLVFKFRPATDGSLVFRCDGYAPGPVATTVVPVRKVYTVLDTFQLRRASDNAALRPLNSASMSLDVNSWTWAFSFSLPLAELGMIEAASDGTPVEVIATVNGVEYRMLAERLTRDRQFPSGAVRVECRGIGGALDVLTGSYSNASGIRSASQIMGDILTVNGVGIGWAIDFGLEDWNIAAGQWAHTGTAVSALQAVAQAAGGYLQPHPTAKTIRVLPKYPVLPWDWAAATPDLELPSAVVTRESIEWVEKPRYNRVYVAGQGQGVLCRVTRAGTDGAILAPQVVDALIATSVAGRQRGGTVLADTGRQAIVSLSLPILAETGIIPPGKLIRYVDGVDTRIGLTRSVSVTINRAGSRQTIGIETHA